MMAESWMARARGLTACAARNEDRSKIESKNLEGFIGLVGDDKARILYGCEAIGGSSASGLCGTGSLTRSGGPRGRSLNSHADLLRCFAPPYRVRDPVPHMQCSVWVTAVAEKVLRLRRLPGWAVRRPASWIRASPYSGRRPSRGRPTDDVLPRARPDLAASAEACRLASI
jgi:hypothetical protein